MRARTKRTTKWIAVIAMATALMLCLAVCASNQEASNSASSSSSSSAAEPEAQTDATQTSGDFSNAVVVYFTGTGNTEKVAAYIAEDTGASSSLGDSAKLLAELAGTGDWAEGHRFSQIATAEEVSQWLESL